MQYLTRPWGRMAYTDAGTGDTPLVLLPGTACYIEDWDAMIAALPQGTRVVTLDFRGHGRSDVPTTGYTMEDLADDAVALIDHLKLGKCIIVGHSLGGMVGTLAAARSPGIKAIVLLEGWTASDSCDGAYAFDRTFGKLDEFAQKEIQRKLDETIARHHPDVWAVLVKSAGAFNSYKWLASATIPIYEVYGDLGRTEDTLTKLRIPENPAIRLVWIPAAGHYLPHEKPKQCADVCVQAIREITR